MLFDATRAATAAGTERGNELLITEEVRGEEKEAEYPVPILGVNNCIVIVIVERELKDPKVAPLSERFSCWSLC